MRSLRVVRPTTRTRRHPRTALSCAIAALATAFAAVPAFGATGLVINGGAPATNNPRVTLALQPPADATSVQVALDETFQTRTTFPVTAEVALEVQVAIPTNGPEERSVRFWVRYRDGSTVLDPVLTEAIVFDTLAPRVGAVRFTQTDPVYVCTPGGPDVGATSRQQLTFSLDVPLVEAGVGSPEFELVDAVPPAPGWRPPTPAVFQSPPQQPLAIRTRDALGNVSAPTTVTTPDANLTELVPSRFPFAAALDCPHPSPARWNRTIRAAWARTGRTARQKERVLVPGSQLAWTFYKGHGLALNWVIAGTALKTILAQKRLDDYRAAFSEALTLSTTDRSGRGRTFRINENWFGTPDGKHGVPWRDGMGTAVLLASLAPALPVGAPRHEQELALRTASEYLETFSVDWRNGGVLWRDRGPGHWFLEYAYLHDERVLNGFMQAVVSLDRFSRQADRFGRGSVGAKEWRALASRARTHVLKGSRALSYWLPRFDLGAGKTRYSLTSGPAPPFYRGYHQELLGQLAQIPYVPLDSRTKFMNYRIRWGGTRLPVS